MHVNREQSRNKVLLILRHAKSSWKNKKLNDHDRPLNKRGRKESVKMGEYLKNMDLIPDTIITSSALRAIETTTLLCRQSGYNGIVEVNFSFHEGNTTSYIQAITTSHEDKDRILIVGHNPTLEQLLNQLTNKTVRLPTCTLVQIKLNVSSWNRVIHHSGSKPEIVDIWRPKKVE
ncbi:MAG: histidine phosphatase family protein [Candidatus Nitrosocosmicus sp.]|jgi:phosphohistidine phosphatase|nr:histidine phosphatase family protein [Candidatus Nitrosocosmicus sp.]